MFVANKVFPLLSLVYLSQVYYYNFLVLNIILNLDGVIFLVVKQR